MSWVSILEDVIERFEDDFHKLKADLPNDVEAVPLEQWRSVARLLARGETVLAEAARHLDMATDPSLDLAHQLRTSIDEAHDLKRRVSEFQKTCLSLMSSLREREGELKQAREEIRTLRTQRNQLEQKLQEVMKANPAGVYAAYSKGTPKKC